MSGQGPPSEAIGILGNAKVEQGHVKLPFSGILTTSPGSSLALPWIWLWPTPCYGGGNGWFFLKIPIVVQLPMKFIRWRCDSNNIRACMYLTTCFGFSMGPFWRRVLHIWIIKIHIVLHWNPPTHTPTPLFWSQHAQHYKKRIWPWWFLMHRSCKMDTSSIQKT